MANEIQYENSQLTGSTLYFVQLDAVTGNGWNGSAYVTYTNTRSTFARTFTEISGTGLWQGTVGGTARYLRFLIFLQSGGSPSFADDVKVAEARYYWDATTLMPQGPVVQVTGSVNSVSSNVTVGSIANNAITSSTIADNAITANKIASAALTAAKFASGALDSVWSATTRLLTAGTNIVLAKGTGITGFNDPTAAATATAVRTELASELGIVTTNLDQTISSVGQYVQNVGIDTAEVKLQTDQLDFTGAAGALKSESTNMRGTDSALLASNYTAPPTTQQIRDAMKLAPSGGAAAVGSIDDKIDDVQSGGTAIPVIQTPVPSSRTWVLKPTSDGLKGELPLTRSVGEAQPFAVSFRHDLGTNGQLVSLDSISFTGSVGGIVIDTLDRGVDNDKAKFKIQALLVGTYVITVEVTYSNGDGGGPAIGDVTLIVK